MFSQFVGSANKIIDDLRREAERGRSEAMMFYHGAGRAKQEIEVLENTKASYLETDR